MGQENPASRRSGERTPEAEKRARLRNPSRRRKMKEEERKVGILDLGIWELGFWHLGSRVLELDIEEAGLREEEELTEPFSRRRSVYVCMSSAV